MNKILGSACDSKALLAVGIFLVCRAIVFFVYPVFLSDVHFYHWAAQAGILAGHSAYKDFFFPYPPLALPMIYIPVFFGKNFESYRLAYQILAFLMDFACLVYLRLFALNRLKLNENKTFLAIMLYTLAGFGVGHLIYDRIDIAVALCFMATAYHFTDQGNKKDKSNIVSYLISAAGALVKLIPLFYWPIMTIIDCFRTQDNNETQSKERIFRSIVRSFSLTVLPFIIVILAWNSMTDGGLFKYLFEHGKRGIQIESTWATPLILHSMLFDHNAAIIGDSYGAQHLLDDTVPKLMLAASKYAGFLCLAALFAWLFISLRKREIEGKSQIDAQTTLYLLLLVPLLLLAGQRVLSTQFFVWIIPGLALFAANSQRPLIPVVFVLGMYSLTLIGFQQYFWLVVKEFYTVMIVTSRNLLLLAVTAMVALKAMNGVRK